MKESIPYEKDRYSLSSLKQPTSNKTKKIVVSYMHKEGDNSEGINPLRKRSLQSIILRAVYLQQDKKSQNVAPLDYQLIHSLAQILRAFEKFKSTSPQSSLMTYHLSLFTHTYIHHEFPIDSHDGLHLWPLARAVLAWETLHLLLLSPHLRQS